MAFTISGSIITQTGTDSDLSGLAGISGVDAIETGADEYQRNIYALGTNHLVVNGTLNINPYIEEFITNFAGGDGGLTINSGGTVNINGSMTHNGITKYTQRRWFTHQHLSIWQDIALWVRSGGTLNWVGGEVMTTSGIQFDATSFVNITSAVIDLYQLDINGNDTPNQQQIRQNSNNLNIDGFLLKRGFFTLLRIPQTLNNYVPEHCDNALAFSSLTANVDIPIRGYSSDGSSDKDVGFWRGCRPVFTNAVFGTALRLGPNGSIGTLNDYGHVRVIQEFNPIIVDATGTGVSDVKVYIRDTDNGNRGIYTSEGYVNGDYTDDRVYEATTMSTGGLLTPLSISTGFVVINNNDSIGDITDTGAFTFDYRGNNNDSSDIYTVNIISYLHTISSYNVVLKGADVVDAGTSVFDDTIIDETDSAIVNAYTSINNAQQLYDRAKLFLVDIFSGETQTLATRSGSTIDTRDLNVVIDPLASAPFDLTGTTITIRTALFVGNIETTGTVTLLNDATVTGSITDSSGTLVPVSVTVRDAETNNLVDDARVYILAAAGGDLPINTIIMNAPTDTSGVARISQIITSDQPVVGRVRKASGSPFFRTSQISGVISNSGLTLDVLMIRDE